MRSSSLILVLSTLIALPAPPAEAEGLTVPSDFLGHEVGADRIAKCGLSMDQTRPGQAGGSRRSATGFAAPLSGFFLRVSSCFFAPLLVPK